MATAMNSIRLNAVEDNGHEKDAGWRIEIDLETSLPSGSGEAIMLFLSSSENTESIGQYTDDKAEMKFRLYPKKDHKTHFPLTILTHKDKSGKERYTVQTDNLPPIFTETPGQEPITLDWDQPKSGHYANSYTFTLHLKHHSECLYLQAYASKDAKPTKPAEETVLADLLPLSFSSDSTPAKHHTSPVTTLPTAFGDLLVKENESLIVPLKGNESLIIQLNAMKLANTTKR